MQKVVVFFCLTLALIHFFADMKCANETRTVCTVLVLQLSPNQTALSYLSCCNLKFGRSVTQHMGLVQRSLDAFSPYSADLLDDISAPALRNNVEYRVLSQVQGILFPRLFATSAVFSTASLAGYYFMTRDKGCSTQQVSPYDLSLTE